MWPSVFIALICVLIPSTFGEEPMRPPECGLSNVTFSKIVGGEPAKLGSWPWMTLLAYGSEQYPQYLCGGSLISARYVLTAAHCILSDLYGVRIGDLDLKDDYDGAKPFIDRIKKIMSHPNYGNNQNDIAVLLTTRQVPFTSILHPICLPYDSDHMNRKLDGLYCCIAGWGRTAWQGSSTTKLMQTQIPIITEKRCQLTYGTKIDKRVVCAGYERGGKDTCQGDSGGPLMLSSMKNQRVWIQYGIVSYGYKCAEPSVPGVYTRVTEFMPYIKQCMDEK